MLEHSEEYGELNIAYFIDEMNSLHKLVCGNNLSLGNPRQQEEEVTEVLGKGTLFYTVYLVNGQWLLHKLGSIVVNVVIVEPPLVLGGMLVITDSWSESVMIDMLRQRV